MRFCEHESVTVDVVDDPSGSGHLVSCNECSRWWRYHMDWRIAWEHFNGWERPESNGSPPETVHVSCSR